MSLGGGIPSCFYDVLKHTWQCLLECLKKPNSAGWARSQLLPGVWLYIDIKPSVRAWRQKRWDSFPPSWEVCVLGPQTTDQIHGLHFPCWLQGLHPHFVETCAHLLITPFYSFICEKSSRNSPFWFSIPRSLLPDAFSLYFFPRPFLFSSLSINLDREVYILWIMGIKDCRILTKQCFNDEPVSSGRKSNLVCVWRQRHTVGMGHGMGVAKWDGSSWTRWE